MLLRSQFRMRCIVGPTALALGVLAILIFPWPTPSPEVIVGEFVPSFVTVNLQGSLERPGVIHVGAQTLVMSAKANSQPTVHLLTAEVPFQAAFSVSVLGGKKGMTFPFQLKVWSPRTEEAVEAWYAPNGAILAGTRTKGQWRRQEPLGVYKVGEPRSWRIERSPERVVVALSGGNSGGAFSATREELPGLFGRSPVSLTLYATSLGDAASTAVVREPIFSVVRQTRYGGRVQSRWFRPVVGLAVVTILLWGARFGRIWRWRFSLRQNELAPLLLLIGIATLGGWWLSKIPGYPYDVRSMKVWSSIAREHGLADISGRSLMTTEGSAHGGQPYAAIHYPYPPLLYYLFWAVGNAAAEGEVERVFKAMVGAAVMGGGFLIYWLLLRHGVNPALVTLVTAAYVLNPAVVFDSMIWGQTDAFVALFLLVGAVGVSARSTLVLWVGIILASLTKQTGLMFAPMLIILGVHRFGTRQLIQGFPASVLVVFLALAPALLSGVHPSSLYQPIVTKVLEFGTVREMEASNAVVSLSSFNLWSLATLVEGAQGWARFAFPDFVPTRFGPSYFLLSRVAFAFLTFFVSFLVLRSKRQGPVHLLALAAYGVGAALLLTRVQPRYFYFGLTFTIAALPWMSRSFGVLALGLLTCTMLISMWGMLVFTSVWYPALIPAFRPETSWFNSAAAAVLGGDAGITIGGLLNTAVLVILLISLWRVASERSGRNSEVSVRGQ